MCIVYTLGIAGALGVKVRAGSATGSRYLVQAGDPWDAQKSHWKGQLGQYTNNQVKP